MVSTGKHKPFHRKVRQKREKQDIEKKGKSSYDLVPTFPLESTKLSMGKETLLSRTEISPPSTSGAGDRVPLSTSGAGDREPCPFHCAVHLLLRHELFPCAFCYHFDDDSIVRGPVTCRDQWESSHQNFPRESRLLSCGK